MNYLEMKASAKLATINLNSVMRLYKSNHNKINALIDLFQLEEQLILKSESAEVTIQVDLIDRARYTTTIRMNYIFNDSNIQIPNAVIRIYHDTNQTEVMSIQNKEYLDCLFSLTKYQGYSNIQARWVLNNFLHKWLTHCLNHKYQ